jgi:hypothetical protein
MRRVAGFGLRWPKLVIVGWLVIVVVLGLAGRGVQHKLLPTQLLVPGTETYHWSELRKGHFGEPMAVLLTGPANAIDRQGPALARALLQRPYTRAVSPWTGGQPARKLRPSPQQALIVLDVDVPKGQNTSTIVPPLQRSSTLASRPLWSPTCRAWRRLGGTSTTRPWGPCTGAR